VHALTDGGVKRGDLLVRLEDLVSSRANRRAHGLDPRHAVPNHGSNPSARPAHSQHGNRQTEGGTAASTYSISPSSNRITGITGALARTYAYDAAGNTTGYSTVTATYNNAGRLKTLNNGSTTGACQPTCRVR
jgi:hypothetical protein